MSLFTERLEAFPRIEPYRFAKAEHLWPYYKVVESAATPKFTIDAREVINFGSNNYLSLSYDPRVIEAALVATRHYGTGVTGSRLLNGTLPLHRELEAELADFYGTESALVFSTGYVATSVALQATWGAPTTRSSTRRPTTPSSPRSDSRAPGSSGSATTTPSSSRRSSPGCPTTQPRA